MRTGKNRLAAILLTLVIAVSGTVPALAARMTVDEVAAQIEALSADARDYSAADRERVEAVGRAFDALSQADQAILDSRTTHPGSSQPLGRVLESALWTVWSFDVPDNSTTLPDGVYNAGSDPALSSEYSKGKSTSGRQRPWSVKEVVVRSGKAYATITVESGTYSGVMLHGTEYPNSAASGNSEFADVPVKLNSTFYFNGVSTSMPVPIAFSLTTSIDEPKPEKDADYTAVDAALAKVPADLSIYTDESVAQLTEAVNGVVRGLKKSEQARVDKMARAIEDALAALVKKPERIDLTVFNDGAAVTVDSAFLRTEKGRTELVITLAGSDIRHLIMGTFAQAAANGGSRDNWIAGKSASGKRTFSIPLSGADTVLPCVAVSRAKLQECDDVTGAFRAWQIMLDTAGKTLTAADYDETVRLKIVNHLDTFKVKGKARVRLTGDPNAPVYSQRIRLTMEDDVYDRAAYTTVKNGELKQVTTAPSEENTFTIRLASTPENRCFRDGEPIEIRFRVRETGSELVRRLTLDLAAGTLTIDGDELPDVYADYSAVDAALAKIPADLSIYTAESAAAVEAARDAVVPNLLIDRQSEVDDMALAIDLAVAALTEADADYSAVDAALAKIPADLSIYTAESAAAVKAARDDVIRGLKKNEQARVNDMARAVEAAVAALARIPGREKLTVTNNTGMFKAVSAYIDRTDKKAQLVITLSGEGYHHLFKGTYEQAVANGNNRNNWITGELNAEGYWEFAIPLERDETYIPCVAISFREVGRFDSGQSPSIARAFYPRQLVIDEAAGTLVTGDYEETVTFTVRSEDPALRVADHASVRVAGGPNSNNYRVAPTLKMLDSAFDRVTYRTVSGGQLTDITAGLGAGNTFQIDLQNAPRLAAFRDGEPVALTFHAAATGGTAVYQMVIDKMARTIVIGGGAGPDEPSPQEDPKPDEPDKPDEPAATPPSDAGKYVDGTYMVDIQIVGEAWHNALVSPTAVYVENGNIYVDIVFKRMQAPFHAPRYDTLTTAYDTYLPQVDEAAYTCAFRRVQVPDLGYQDIVTVTSAMSQPYEVGYTIFIDPANVPLTDPAQAEDIDRPDPPQPADRPDDPAEPPAPGGEDTDSRPEPSTPADDAGRTDRAGLPTAAVIAIAAGAALAGGAGGYAIGKRSRKGERYEESR